MNAVAKHMLRVVALLLLLGMPAGSSADYDMDMSGMSLEDLLEIDVVYGASKYQQKTTEAPSTVTIFTEEEIRLFGYETLADVMQDVRGLFATSDRSYSYIGVRGFARPGDYNTRLLVLVDGTRTNDVIYGSASFERSSPIDLELVERIEVITGPGSSLYGSNAYFGVVNIVTKEAKETGQELSAGVGSHGMTKGRITWRRGGPLQLEASLSHYASQGQDLYSAEFDTPDQNDGVYENGDAEEATHLHLKASLGAWRLDGAYGLRTKHAPYAAWETVFNDDRTRDTDAYGFLSLLHTAQLGLSSEMVFRMSYQFYDYKGHYIYDYTEEEDAEPWLMDLHDTAVSSWIHASVMLTTVAGQHKLVFGGESTGQLQADQSVFDSDPYWLYMENKTSGLSIGMFVQDEFRLSESLMLNAGLRFDHEGEGRGFLSPRLAAIYQLRPDTRVKAIWGQAYRAPSSYELEYHDGYETTKPNPDLDIEHVQTAEVILEHELSPQLRVVASVFRNELSDLISQVEDPADELLIFRNMESIRSEGVELAMEGQWQTWRLRCSWSYQRTRETDSDAELSNSPAQMLKANLAVPLLSDRTMLGLSLRTMSSRLSLDGNAIGGYALVDARLNHHFGEHLTVGLGVRNLLDQEYSDPGSTEHEQERLFQDGRTFRLSVTVNF